MKALDPLVGSFVPQMEHMTNKKGKRTDLELEVCNKENLDHLNMENAYEEEDA